MHPGRSRDGGMALLPALMEEIVEEILLRIPPEEPPAHLIRAAMVCKAWCRILSDGGFRRRYCRFHRTPPTLLGFICSVYCDAGPQFVATTRWFSPPHPLPTSSYYMTIDCRHGRVLIQDRSRDDDSPTGCFIVWDSITGNQQHVSFPAYYPHRNWTCSFTGAVLCARHRHGCCDHLDCHDGPFLVVFVGTTTMHDAAATRHMHTWASVYSSETGAWSAQICSADPNCNHAGGCRWRWAGERPSLLIGDALYFSLVYCHVIRILKYDLGGHALSVVDDTPDVYYNLVPIADIHGGGLGFAEYHHHSNCIYTWSRQAAAADANNGGVLGGGGWVRDNVVADLNAPGPYSSYRRAEDTIIRFAEGTNTILFTKDHNIDWGVYTLDLQSRQVRKVANIWEQDMFPYVSYYTPPPADLAKGKLTLR